MNLTVILSSSIKKNQEIFLTYQMNGDARYPLTIPNSVLLHSNGNYAVAGNNLGIPNPASPIATLDPIWVGHDVVGHNLARLRRPSKFGVGRQGVMPEIDESKILKAAAVERREPPRRKCRDRKDHAPGNMPSAGRPSRGSAAPSPAEAARSPMTARYRVPYRSLT
jgi:hypothetical protein